MVNGRAFKVSELERTMSTLLVKYVELGGWSEWGEWTVCTAICSQGRRMKERTCNNPRPQGEGRDCVGDSYAVEECSHHAPFCEGTPETVSST